MIDRDEPIKLGGNGGTRRGNAIVMTVNEDLIEKGKVYDKKYPSSILDYSNRTERGAHPTQKPTDLLRYLIRTYTRPGELVLDNTMGSGSTGVAAIRERRTFKGIEKDPTYFATAMARIAEARNESLPKLVGTS